MKWPQTVFSGAIRPRLSSIPSIRVQVSSFPHLTFLYWLLKRSKAYLPSSRVTPLNKTIPFTVSLLADGEILLPFRSSTTSLTSFHPLSRTHSASSFVSRLAPNSRPPLKVHLERHTFTKARATGVLVFGTSENGISSSEILAEGSVYHMDQREGSVSWSGELMIPESVECGGFRTERLKVEVSLSSGLSLNEVQLSRHKRLLTLCDGFSRISSFSPFAWLRWRPMCCHSGWTYPYS